MAQGNRASMPSRARWYGLAAAVAALDFATKIAVLKLFAPGESLPLAPFFNGAAGQLRVLLDFLEMNVEGEAPQLLYENVE